jgi:hypothetical protein
MHRIDADGHVANHFSDGDQSLGISGTRVDAVWLNAVQEEICNLLAARGVTLAKGTNTQLRDSMVGAAAAWASLNGTAIQDGNNVSSVARSGANNLVVTLSKTMANVNYAVVLSSDIYLTSGAQHLHGIARVVSKTTTSFTLNYLGPDLETVLDINTLSYSGAIDFAVHGDLA